jgi:hypothetical protein
MDQDPEVQEGGGQPACPLCRVAGASPVAEAHGRRFLRCGTCALLFVHPADRPTPADELAHYRTHENDAADPRYRAFLARLADPLVARLPAGASGLDYGAGPAPALAQMLTERGFPTAAYDPFFAPESRLLERDYDFVTCTETAEHFHDPAAEFARLAALLRQRGILGVMTEILDDEPDIPRWRYARDPTHVCFYDMRTMEWIAGRHGWRMERPGRTVALFHAP